MKRFMKRIIIAGGLIAVAAGTTLPRLSAAGSAKSPPPSSRQPHPHGSYQEDCGLCHGEGAWSPAVVSPKFKHAPGRFPLQAAHAQAACMTCHKSLDFTGRKPVHDCASCHQDVHQGEFGLDCARCHTTRSFIEHSRMLRAHTTTRFPLVGAHLAASCEGCHPSPVEGRGSYVNLSTECESCHTEEYLATTNPNHQALGFPRECQQCHTPVAWQATSNIAFNHGSTGFPLTGAHAGTPCASCHGANQYTGLNSSCLSCHQQDYDQAADPPHAGFSTDCAQCHGTTAWAGATFEHDSLYFPIYSGAHRGKWDSCSDCHMNAGSWSQFQCWGACHTHEDPANMANKHSGVSGYTHDSQACYTCHPQGRR